MKYNLLGVGEETLRQAVQNYVEGPSMEQYMELQEDYGLETAEIRQLEEEYQRVKEFQKRQEKVNHDLWRRRWDDRGAFFADFLRGLGTLAGDGMVESVDYGGEALTRGVDHGGEATSTATGHIGDAITELISSSGDAAATAADKAGDVSYEAKRSWEQHKQA